MRRALIIGIVLATVIVASSVAIAAPTAPTLLVPNGTYATGTTILLGAQDADLSVTSIDFIDASAGGTVLATASIRGLQNTFSVPWPVTVGTHTIVARAQDGTASTDSTTSAIVTGDSSAPLVAITAPLASAFVRGSAVSITGTTSDDTTVTKIEVFAGTSLIGTINQPGSTWSQAWSTIGQSEAAPINLTARATDAVGRTTTTPARAVTVDNTQPAAFTVSAITPVASNPTLGWSAATDAHGPTYSVSRDGGTPVNVGSALAYVDTGAPQGLHTYVVTAADSAGNATTATASVLVDATGATAPTGLAGKSPTKEQPTISWTPPSGVTISGWQVFRDGSTTPIAVPAAVTSFVDTSALKDGPHIYQVRGLNQSSSPLTASTPFTVVLDTTPPAVPQPTPTALDDGSIAFSWPAVTDPSPGTGITQVYLRASGSEVCSGDAALTQCTDHAALVGVAATYSLFAIDRAGNIASQAIDVTARDAIPPAAPRGVTIKAKNRIATLVWKAASPQDGVSSWKVIQLAARTTKPRSPSDGTPVCPLVPATITTCTSKAPLKNGVPVRFAVYAVDEASNVSAPTVVLVKPTRADPKAPIIVGGVQAKIGAGHTFVTLTWKKPPDPDLKEFVIRWLPSRYPPGVKVGFFAYRGQATSVKLGQKPGTTRFYAVYATDRSGNASPAARVKVVMPKAVKAKPRKPGSGPVIKIN